MIRFPRFVTAALATASLSLPAFAKGDDVDFARGLVQNGFVDLATEYCERLAKDPATSAEDKAGLQLIQAEIHAKNATLQEDPIKGQAELDLAIEVLEGFIRTNGSHPRAPEAKFQIGMLLRQKGEFCVNSLKKETEAEKKSKLASDGDGYFKKAEEYFEALKIEYAKLKDEWYTRTNGKTPSAEENRELETIEFNLMDSVYNVPRTLYSHALLFEPGAKEKKDLAKKAISAFMDFELDYGNMMKAFESSIFWALTHKELGEFSDCYPRFDFTISLKTFFDGSLPDDAREIVLTGYYYKALTYNEERKFREGIQTITEMMSDPMLKNAAQMRIGISALLVQGDAYVGLGEKEKAIALGQKLLKEVTNEGMQSLIKRRVTEWAAGGGGDVGIHLMAYDTAMESDRFAAAISALQKAVAAAEQSDQPKEIPELLWRMASVYGAYMERLYDAVIVYETIANDFPASDKAARSAFEAARLWARIARDLSMEKGFEKDQVTKNLELLTKKWPSDPNAKNAQFLVAEAYYDKGQYEEGAKAYGLVPPEATYYEQAMVMCGKAYYDLGKKLWAEGKQDDKTKNLFAQSEAAFAKFLKYLKENPAKTELDQKNRPAVEAFCKQALANLLMHDARKKYDEALKVLDEIEASNPQDEVRKRVLSQKVKAYLTLKLTDKAIATTELMLTSYANASVTVDACQLVGQRCDEEAEAIVGPDPTPEKITDAALKYWELAAKYYANWIHSAVQAKSRIAPADALAVADRIYNLGVIINALDDKKSFTSYDLNSLKNVRIFRDAAKIYEPISNEELGSLKGIDTGKLMLKRAWCNCWAQEWEQARDSYELLIDSERLRNAGGKTLNDGVLKAKAWLFVAYEELGHVYIKLGEASINKSQSLQEAYVIFANVVDKSTKDTEGWWRAKYLVIKILFDRGGQGDFEMSVMGIENMRMNYPKWDDNKFGLSSMYDALEASINAKKPQK